MSYKVQNSNGEVLDNTITTPAELITLLFYPDGKPPAALELTSDAVKKIQDKLAKALSGADLAHWQSEIAKILEHHKRHHCWKISSFNTVQISSKTERSLLNESTFMLSAAYDSILESALMAIKRHKESPNKVSFQILVGACSILIADETGRFDAKTIKQILRSSRFIRAGNLLLVKELYENAHLLFTPGLLLIKKCIVDAGIQQFPDIEESIQAFLKYEAKSPLTKISLKQLEKVYQQREMNLLSPLLVSQQNLTACIPLRIEHLLRISQQKTMRLASASCSPPETVAIIKPSETPPKGFVTRREAIRGLSQQLKQHTVKGKKRYQALSAWFEQYQQDDQRDELTDCILNFIISLASDRVSPAYASSTLDRYLSALNPLIEIFEYQSLSDRDTDALAAGFQKLLNRTASNVTQAILPRFIASIRHLIPDAARLLAQLDMSADQIAADARILGPREGSDLVQKLLASEHRWDLENGLIIALGFYCGLRRGEVLGLRLMDIEGAAFPYLRIKSNQYRKLKSSGSNRTLAIKHFLPAEILNALLQLKRTRAEESRDNLQRRLFHPRSKKVILADDERMAEINLLLKEQTGDPGFSFHNLRHSFANWLLLRLLIAVEPDIRTLLENVLQLDESFSLSNCRQLFRDQINNDPDYGSRFILHYVSQQLGHSSPTVTLKSYIHILPLIEYAMKSVKRQEVYREWTGLILFKSAGKHGYNLQERFNKQSKGFSYALEQHCWHHLREAITLEPVEDLPAFEPPPAVTMRGKLKANPLSLRLLQTVLSRLYVDKMSLQQVAAQMNLAITDLQRLAAISDEILAIRIRSNRARAKFPTILSRVIGEVEQQLFDRLIKKMDSVNFDWKHARAAKAILRLQPNRNLIPFDNRDELAEFIELLKALDIPLNTQEIHIDLDKQDEVFSYTTETNLLALKQNILPVSLQAKSRTYDVVISKGNPLVSQLKHQGIAVNTKQLDIPYKGSGNRVYLKPVNPELPKVASPALKNTLMLCYLWWRYIDT